MVMRPKIAIIAGGLVAGVIAIVGARGSDQAFVDNLRTQASAQLQSAGAPTVKARFFSRDGWPTRHPVLSGGEALDEGLRDKAAKAVGTIAGVGGVSWSDGTMLAEAGDLPMSPSHCQNEVKALLSARSIRFEESSSELAEASDELLAEVTAALKPCHGSIIGVTGHTDATGPEPENIALSQARAQTVVSSLEARGISAEALRARGLGSSEPIEGLSAQDPANRRIEFAVISTQPIFPTPIDTPGPR